MHLSLDIILSFSLLVLTLVTSERCPSCDDDVSADKLPCSEPTTKARMDMEECKTNTTSTIRCVSVEIKDEYSDAPKYKKGCVFFEKNDTDLIVKCEQLYMKQYGETVVCHWSFPVTTTTKTTTTTARVTTERTATTKRTTASSIKPIKNHTSSMSNHSSSTPPNSKTKWTPIIPNSSRNNKTDSKILLFFSLMSFYSRTILE